MSSTTVTRGNSHETFYIGPNLTPVSVASYTSAGQTFTIAGFQTSDIVSVVGLQGAQTAGIIIGECDVLTAGILTVQFANTTAGAVTPAAGTYVFQVTRVEGPLPTNAV